MEAKNEHCNLLILLHSIKKAYSSNATHKMGIYYEIPKAAATLLVCCLVSSFMPMETFVVATPTPENSFKHSVMCVGFVGLGLLLLLLL